MERSRLVLLSGKLVLLTAVLALIPARSKAEPFVDLGLGVAVTQDAHAKIVGTDDEYARVKFDTSFSVSGRGGYWFDGLPWLGVAGSVGYFKPDVKEKVCDVDCKIGGMTVIPLSLLVMGRVPLMTSKDYPNGQLQPYIGVGPGLFISDFSPRSDAGAMIADIGGGAGKVKADTAVDVGLDFRLGAAYDFMPHIGVFGEYALSYAAPRLKLTQEGETGYVKVDTEFTTHRFLVGVRYSF